MDALKAKAVDWYEYILERLQDGYKEDYSTLLSLIMFIEMDPKFLDNEIIEHRFLTMMHPEPCYNPLKKTLDDIKQI